MSLVENYARRLWERVPLAFAVLGLFLLGFGRKAARFEAQGGDLPDAAWGVALVAVAAVVWAVQFYRRWE